MPRRLLPLLSSLILLLSGCESVPDPGADAFYQPATGAAVASVRGCRISEGGLFGSDHTGFVSMVDLQPVAGAADRWNESLALAPGKHTLAADYRYSNFMARAYLKLEARAGGKYQLMIKNVPPTPTDNRLYCDFWIVDTATGSPVTPVHHQQANGAKRNSTIFYRTD